MNHYKTHDAEYSAHGERQGGPIAKIDYMTQTLDLRSLELEPISAELAMQTNGGGLWDAVLGWAVGKVLNYVAENADFSEKYTSVGAPGGYVPSSSFNK